MVGVDRSQVVLGYEWLGHGRVSGSVTELVALHPEYRPGKAHYERNRQQNLFPRTHYVRTVEELESFVRCYHPTRMVCIGLNPRPAAFVATSGYARGALEQEILLSMNCLWDWDFPGNATGSARDAFRSLFVPRAYSFFDDHGLHRPQLADSGRGYHFLFAHPPVLVSDCHDIRDRLVAFQREFRQAYDREIADLGVRLDSSTLDLRRVVRVPGTAKPAIGLVSRFLNYRPRNEDHALREYLLRLQPVAEPQAVPLAIQAGLPGWFHDLLAKDEQLQRLWGGKGKPQGLDTSPSGFDYTIARYLLRKGYRNIDELATILFYRPEGSVQKSGKDVHYVTRTVAAALR